jgi:hypothetical protein
MSLATDDMWAVAGANYVPESTRIQDEITTLDRAAELMAEHGDHNGSMRTRDLADEKRELLAAREDGGADAAPERPEGNSWTQEAVNAINRMAASSEHSAEAVVGWLQTLATQIEAGRGFTSSPDWTTDGTGVPRGRFQWTARMDAERNGIAPLSSEQLAASRNGVPALGSGATSRFEANDPITRGALRLLEMIQERNHPMPGRAELPRVTGLPVPTS